MMFFLGVFLLVVDIFLFLRPLPRGGLVVKGQETGGGWRGNAGAATGTTDKNK